MKWEERTRPEFKKWGCRAWEATDSSTAAKRWRKSKHWRGPGYKGHVEETLFIVQDEDGFRLADGVFWVGLFATLEAAKAAAEEGEPLLEPCPMCGREYDCCLVRCPWCGADLTV
jgi:hypothetical protein